MAFGKRHKESAGETAPHASAPPALKAAIDPAVGGGPIDLARLPPPVPVDMAAPIPALQQQVDTAMGHHASEYVEDAAVEVGAGDGTQARPGWYPDPAGEKSYRWWDGTQWTLHVD